MFVLGNTISMPPPRRACKRRGWRHNGDMLGIDTPTSLLRLSTLLLLLVSGCSGDTPLLYDEAGLFTDEQRHRLVEYHRYLLQDHDIDYRILTTRHSGDINRYANERYRALGVGSQSGSGRGLLLVIDPSQNRARLEVSMGLEGIFVDALVAYLEREQMRPFFRANRVADGILATSELLITRAQNAKANTGFYGEVWHADSAGAGASIEADIGSGYRRPGNPADDVPPGETPAETVTAYIEAMREHNLRPDLSLYTAATRAMLADWVVTTAQADNVVRTQQQCTAEPARIGPNGRLAVIRYPIEQRQCAPWFLRFEQGAWRLDLNAMQQAIRFGRSNAWHMAHAGIHPYRFAFNDWRFDQNGYPITSD